jgi:hypothetical protein
MVLPPDAELCLVGHFYVKVVDIVGDRILELIPHLAQKRQCHVGARDDHGLG